MTRWQMIKIGWQVWRNKRRYERWQRMSNAGWDKSVSVGKAKAAAVPVGVGAAIVALLRSVVGEKLPWGPENDAWVAGVLMTVLAAGIAYVKNKMKHNGGVFHTLTPEEQAAQTVFYNRVKAEAEAKRKENPSEEP